MKKRVLKVFLIGCIMGLFLTGCTKFPEMTDEEYDQVVQYAVSILMKNSNNGVEKLSSLNSLELEKQMKKEAREAKKAARDAETAARIANGTGNTEEGINDSNAEISTEDINDQTDIAKAENDPLDDLTNTEETPLDEQTNTETTADENEPLDDSSNASSDDLDELLNKFGDELDEGIENSGIENTADEPETDENDQTQLMPADNNEAELTVPDNTGDGELSAEADKAVDGMRQELSKGIFLTYSGYSVAGSYPDNDDVFVINATSGKKLLILNFRIANTSGMDVSVDMEKANPHFQVLLNGVNVGYTNVTMLENDLSSFKGTIPADAKLSMVLIKQMDASKLKNVESLGLIGDMGTETIQFNLE